MWRCRSAHRTRPSRSVPWGAGPRPPCGSASGRTACDPQFVSRADCGRSGVTDRSSRPIRRRRRTVARCGAATSRATTVGRPRHQGDAVRPRGRFFLTVNPNRSISSHSVLSGAIATSVREDTMTAVLRTSQNRSRATRRSCIYVLAGTNGAGKSSVAGAMFRRSGADYFNPDEATARILAANSGISAADANSAAWHQGKRLLERAIAERLDFAFETTLGGQTISALLQQALAIGIEVRMWFVGLSSPELHMARVRARVARGGHDIPEEKIRERYDRSRINLIELMPRLTELRVFDNSLDADPHAGRAPQPTLVLRFAKGKILETVELSKTPQWAK